MNMQQLMQQAQRMQREITKTKEEIDAMLFTSESSWVRVEMTGKKVLKSIKIVSEGEIKTDDIEAMEDMILIAINDCMKKIDVYTEEKMGKYSSALNGLM